MRAGYQASLHKYYGSSCMRYGFPGGKTHLPMQETQEMWVRSPDLEDPLEKEMATTPVFLLWKFHGQKSLVGYSPRGHKESDMT